MKNLFLVRHAKSSWKDISLSDFDRPLNKRGKHDAPMMAKIFKNEGFLIDTIISSPAKRAASTARFFINEFQNEKLQFQFDQNIYEASYSQLINIINTIDDAHNSAMLIGHNPGFTYLAEKLCSENFGNIPTCGLVGINFNLKNWAYISENSGVLFHYDYPKKHY